MAKYVDNEIVYRFAQDQKKKETGAYSKGWNYAMDVIKSAMHNNDAIPAADVRPVVLCRDCDNWNDWDSAGRESLGNFRCSCAYWSVEDGPVFYTAPTDFCSYAEKREVEHD